MLKRLISLVSGVVFCVALLMPIKAQAAEPVVGAVNNWFSSTGATRLSVDFTIQGSQNGYHYYSIAPYFDGKFNGKDFGLYSGIQTTKEGPLYIFSVWNAKAAYPENGAYKVAFGGEGEGYSLRKKYDWKLGTTYTVTIKREGYDTANKGWRWSSTITNKSTGASLKLGEIPAPASATSMRLGSVFHERFMGTAPVCGKTNNLEKVSMSATNLSGDKPVSFYSQPQVGGSFAVPACKPFMGATNTKNSATTRFGMTQAELDNILRPKPQPTPIPATPAPTTPQVAGTSTTTTPAPTPVTTTTPTPVTQPIVETAKAPAELPSTGIGTFVLIALPILVGAFAGLAFYLRKNWYALASSLLNRL